MRKTTMTLCAGLLLACISGLKADTAETIPFLALMQAGNETPPITDTSSGAVIIWVHVIRDSSGAITSGSVDFNIAAKFSSAVTVTGLHIHNGAAGVAGPIVIPTDVNATEKSIAIDALGRATILKQVQFPQTTPALPASVIQDLINNPPGFYANIHTVDHAGGAMRGQLARAETKVIMGLMSTQNEVPPVPLPASGVATVTLLRALNSAGTVAQAEAIFNLEYTGFEAGTTFTGFHIHNGAAGVNGPVIINTGIAGGANSVTADPSGTGNLNYQVAVTSLDATFANEVATINALFDNPRNNYINIHTTTFGGGVMRDQLRNTEKGQFQVSLLPSNETPPITGLTATAQTSVPVYLLRNADGSVAAGTVIFDVNFRGFPASTTISGLHIHAGAAGVAGGIVIPGGVDNLANKVVSDTGSGNIFKTMTVATTAGIAALNQLVQNPNGFYENLHTTVNAGGAMRAQLASAAAKPVITGLAAASSTITTAAPGSIVSIYGTDLAAYASDLTGFPVDFPALVTSMNGVTATVAGVKAPFYYVAPGLLNVQVPFEVAAGSQPVIVTTPAGASPAQNLTVAGVAPSIFIIDLATSLGAIVKSSDFSLVTSSNKVSAGDTIVIYATGLGQTTPAALTGVRVVPPPGGFNNTSTVSVTIGGQTATPVSSVLVPGYVSLYQTAVVVPSGVSGNSPVVLKSGTASSNTVTLAVQ